MPNPRVERAMFSLVYIVPSNCTPSRTYHLRLGDDHVCELLICAYACCLAPLRIEVELRAVLNDACQTQL